MNTSPFSKLPPDLRNHIYQLALGPIEELHLRRRKRRRICYDPSGSQTEVKIVLSSKRQRAAEAVGLLRTCQQIHAEFTPVFYGTLCWVADLHRKETVSFIKRMVETIGPRNASLLRDIRLELKGGDEEWLDRSVIDFKIVIRDTQKDLQLLSHLCRVRARSTLRICDIELRASMGDIVLEVDVRHVD